jgi:hypothetical protein
MIIAFGADFMRPDELLSADYRTAYWTSIPLDTGCHYTWYHPSFFVIPDISTSQTSLHIILWILGLSQQQSDTDSNFVALHPDLWYILIEGQHGKSNLETPDSGLKSQVPSLRS